MNADFSNSCRSLTETVDCKVPDSLFGLTPEEVTARQMAGQGNNISLPTSRTYVQIFRQNVFTFINAVFLTITLVLVSLGNFGDAVLVVVVIFAGVVVNVVQELWAKQQLDHIAVVTRPKSTVIRAGQPVILDPSGIVQGDIIQVQAGDQIVVDGVIVGEGQIEVDESLLTGESDLIFKQPGNSVFSGTYCVSGQAYYQAQKVGSASLAYQLAASARSFRQILTPLQQEINLVIRIFILLACFLWFLVSISILTGLISLADGVQRAAVIAGLVPSGLYMTITLAYAIGAVRMLGKNVLIQQVNAVESLSNVEILCLDKTGTLTANRFQLESLEPLDLDLAEFQRRLGNYAASLAYRNRTTDALLNQIPGQPQPLITEIPFSSLRQWSGLVIEESQRLGIYILGAPEVLAPMISLFPPHWHESIDRKTEQGLRVLLLAYTPQLENPFQEGNPQLPPDLKPLGLITLKDELRPECQKTLAQFAGAGIKIKIISGDHPQTVEALAKQAGIQTEIHTISGPELAQLDAIAFRQAAQTHTIFGRVTPEQKAQLVEALRHPGAYVAMIGDGVNDVLSLKQANLAIAMESGSKAARSVADIVLLGDSFSALPHTFLEGQRIRNAIQDVLKLFMVRVFCVTLLILASGQVLGTFPLLNKHSAVITILAVGLPTFGFPLWAQPGISSRRSLLRSLLHFTLPATLTLTLVALVVYLIYLVGMIWLTLIANDGNGIEILDQQLLAIPRSALVHILVICELLLVPFVKPPCPWWVGGERLSGDWRYTLVAGVSLITYLLILRIDALRDFFELSLLAPADYLILSGIALLWCLFLRYSWRGRLLDRFLGVDLQ